MAAVFIYLLEHIFTLFSYEKREKKFSLSEAHYKCYQIFEAQYKNIKHFNTRTKYLSLEDMF